MTASHFRVINDCDSTRRVSEGSGQAATASPRIEDDPDFNGRIALHCVMRHVHSEVAVIVKFIILMNRSTSNCTGVVGTVAAASDERRAHKVLRAVKGTATLVRVLMELWMPQPMQLMVFAVVESSSSHSLCSPLLEPSSSTRFLRFKAMWLLVPL